MSKLEIVNPESLGEPKGFSHGIIAQGGRMVFIAGQPGHVPGSPGASGPSGASDPSGAPGAPPPPFEEQFAHALDRVIAVVNGAGGQPTDIVRLTIYVTDLKAYLSSREHLGERWKERFDRYYPATTLVEVKGLVDEGAVVEIEATAMIG
jgi:enamine deaminase RidA (YjgF/YER057c/UK114 family)